MPDQPSDPADQPIDPADQPADPTEQPSGAQAFGETLRAKLDEYEVERHLEELVAEVESVVRRGMEAVGAFAQEHRHDIDDFLSRAADTLDRRTDGRHAETIQGVRGQLERGVQRIAGQRPGDAAGDVAGDVTGEVPDDVPGDVPRDEPGRDPGESASPGPDEVDR
jgi:hypothetical protein